MGNQKLENMLDEMRARTSEKKLPEDFIAMLKESDVIVPAIMPAGTDPEILHKLMEYSDKNMGLPPEANPQPCVLQNPAGQKYLPVFTSEEQVRNAPKESKFPLLMTMPFASCLQLLKQTEELSGIAVNPYSHNILFTPNAESKDGKKTVEVTIEQFHHLTRQRLESNYLPLQLFKRKQELFDDLRTRQGECMKELYNAVYDTEVACPYTEDDFEFMSLQISDELQIMQITMPKENAYPMTCPSVIVVWDAAAEEIYYFAIVAKDQNDRHIMRVEKNGTPVDCGVAPTEGSELSAVIDLVENLKETE